MSFAKLDQLCRSLDALDHALAMLGVDEATQMPPGGGEARADAMASLSAMRHARFVAPEVGEWIAAAKAETLDSEQQAAVRELERSWIAATCLPAEFVEKYTQTRMRCEQLWRDMRARNDWKGFAPALANVLSMARDEASMRAQALGLDPYDAMIDQWDPGTTQAMIDPVFDELKTFLKAFVPRAIEVQEKRLEKTPLKPLSGNYPVERQRALGLAMMEAVGFDMNHGGLSVSHHPFCGGVPTDVRLTTRYRTDEFLSALMGVLHETGHGLYEQNLPAAWLHWPSGKARGMAMHESQSLFVEKQIGRNPSFWRFALPHLEKHLGEHWTLDDILPHVHKVARGYIRVDADEVTYPLHVILRYEIERELFAGRLEIADLPEAWDAKMRDYLGLSTIDNPKDGPMQDVHWPSGGFGYFPSYTLGAIIAAQQWATIIRAHPEAEDEFAAGSFVTVNDWRRRHVWHRASMASTPELLVEATGEPLNATHFIRHLEDRYGTA